MAISAYVKAIIAITAVVGALADSDDQAQSAVILRRNDPNWTVNFVKKFGYPIETHEVKTEDGYLLTLYRIPSNKAGTTKGGPPVLLQHGFLGQSGDFVVLGPGSALGFILADKGFDVWIANARGTTDSRKHADKNPSASRAYWEFSWHEIGVYDFPAQIDYVLQKTGRKSLSVVAFSMGTTAFFVMASQKPAYNAKVNNLVALGPVAYMEHVRGPLLKYIAPLTTTAPQLVKFFGRGEFMPSTEFMHFALKKFCQEDKVSQKLCQNILFMMFGFNKNGVNSTLVDTVSQYSPAGGSTKTLIHFGQLVRRAPTFRQYSYGSVQNLLKYKSASPPSYNTRLITCPVHLFMSDNDWFASKKDVYRLVSELPNSKTVKVLSRPNFNHMDFVYANDAKDILYPTVVQILEADKAIKGF